jgi:hypothetical protein
MTYAWLEPIGAAPSEAQRRAYAVNVAAAWFACSAEQRSAGRRWYREAHDIAKVLASGDVIIGAGVIAALSPQTSWTLNLELAARAFDDGYASGHVGDATRKADRIMSGEDPESVLPTGSKTLAFYQCIRDAGEGDAVVIDRHAHDVAVGQIYGGQDRGLDHRGRRPAIIAEAYRTVATMVCEPPCAVQAAVWVRHVEQLGRAHSNGWED